MLNKRAQTGYTTIFIYRLFMILILIGGVVVIVGAHFSKPIDIRPVEAQEISKLVYDCIKNLGIENINEQSLQECFPYSKEENGIKITYNDKKMTFGKELIITLCEAKEETKSKVSCSLNEYPYFSSSDNKLNKISILVGISKVNKNV